MLKEEIKANATFKIYEVNPINPVNNIIKVNDNREQEREASAEKNFADLLAAERAKKQDVKKPTGTQEKLRLMGGLNQYNRQALHVCYILSNEADYKA